MDQKMVLLDTYTSLYMQVHEHWEPAKYRSYKQVVFLNGF